MATTNYPRNRMRMRELLATTGVTKATVQHYVNEGLIPKPIKTSRNAALYNASHVKAIRMIRELQSKRFLPLSVIKKVVKGGRGGLTVTEIRTLAELDGKLFRNVQEVPRSRPVSARELCERTGVPPEDIRMMVKSKMIGPVKRGKEDYFEEDDVRIVECYAKLQDIGLTRAMGFDPSILTSHRDMMRILVEEEAKILLSRTAGKIPVQEIPAMVEEAMSVLNQIIALFHKKSIIETTRSYSLEIREKGTR